MTTTTGRRLPVPASNDVNDVIGQLEPGDYCGPISGYSGDKPAVFFRLPDGSGIRHVVSPPHVFTEQPDGSLQIRESILAENGWHGYLDAGHIWRQL